MPQFRDDDSTIYLSVAAHLLRSTYNRSDLTGECMNSTPILSTYTPMRCFSISSRVIDVDVPSPVSERSGAAVAGGTDGDVEEGGTWNIPFKGYEVVLSSPYLAGLRAPTGLSVSLDCQKDEIREPTLGPSDQEDQSGQLDGRDAEHSQHSEAREHSCSYYRVLLPYLARSACIRRGLGSVYLQSGSSYLVGTRCPNAASS
jgi:hypothetical protein